jgi:Zn-dependent protease with chaperone function
LKDFSPEQRYHAHRGKLDCKQLQPLGRARCGSAWRRAIAPRWLLKAGHDQFAQLDRLNTSGGQAGGGFLSTHPATEERIQALRRMQ